MARIGGEGLAAGAGLIEKISFCANIAGHEKSSSLSLLSLEGVYGSRFAAPLDGAVGGRPGRHRCRSSGVYATRLQLHGVGAGTDRHRGVCRGVFGLLRVDRAHAADLAGNSGAARPRHADELRHSAHAGQDGADGVLALCRADGAVARDGVPGLHRNERGAGVLHHRRHLRCDEPLWLYDAARSLAVRLVSCSWG